MFSRVRIAIRFFFVGLAVGILMAPRSGEETRRMLREKADGLLNNILDAASMGAEPAPTQTTSRGTSRSGNGSGRGRSSKPAADVTEEATSEAGV